MMLDARQEPHHSHHILLTYFIQSSKLNAELGGTPFLVADSGARRHKQPTGSLPQFTIASAASALSSSFQDHPEAKLFAGCERIVK